MKKIDILSYPIYTFTCDNNLADEIYNSLRNLTYINSVDHNNNSMDTKHDFFHDDLFNFFDESISSLKQIYFSDQIEFPIVDCWVNRYGPLQSLRKHTHSNAVISGLYFVNEDINFGATNFNIVDPWCQNFLSDTPPYEIMTLYKQNPFPKTISGDIFPTKGSLLLFPSHIFHYVKPSKNTKNFRYTISFNCFPSGTFSENNTSKLSFEVNSIRKRNGQTT